MATITISKNLIKNDDLVIIPRKEYESMKAQMVPTFYLIRKRSRQIGQID